MNKQLFTIKELKINKDDSTGVEVISFVEKPAIELNFDFFGLEEFKKNYIVPEKLPYFKFTALPDPEIIPTSHPFCKEHAGRVYHESEINQWASLNHGSGDYYSSGWIQESNFFQNFNGETSTTFSGSEQLYNCRHTLLRCTSMNEVPTSKWKYLPIQANSESNIYLTMSDELKHEVSGPVLISGKMIYRSNCDGLGNPGYVHFSRETVRLAMKKFGYNRTISVNHKDDLTGSAILLDSWLTEDEKMNQTIWSCRYKILGQKLWDYVQSKQVLGFSIESLFAF